LSWAFDWLWGVPLLVATTVTHVSAVVLAAEIIGNPAAISSSKTRFVIFIALAALATAALLGIEATAWAVLYVSLGALPDLREGMLYSLNAITSFGHAAIYLDQHWQLLGAIEAVNGLILFGLATATLTAAIQRAWPIPRN
jgi:hypothetical protein